MPGTKTNERPGTRAVLRHSRMSPYKAREVLDLVRGRPVGEALEILKLCERDAAIPIAKLLVSAVANAEHNDQMDPDELFVSACFADEGVTMKRWRPRARGRATRIRKRACHVTLIVSRLPEDKLERLAARRSASLTERRSKRVAASRRAKSGADSGKNEAQADSEKSSASVSEDSGSDEMELNESAESEASTEAEGASASAEAETTVDESSESPADEGETEHLETGTVEDGATEGDPEDGKDV